MAQRKPSPSAKRASTRPTPAEQSRRFIETARELGCDEDEAAFRDKLRVIARKKPEPAAAKQKTPKKA